MSVRVDFHFDALPAVYVAGRSYAVALGGGPPGNLPAGTIGAWGIGPPIPPAAAEIYRTPRGTGTGHAQANLSFKTVDHDYVPAPSSDVPLHFFKPYKAPAGNAVGLNFRDPYTPPSGNAVKIDFSNGDSSGPKPEQFLFPGGWASLAMGAPSVSNWMQYVRQAGWVSQAFGVHAIANKARLLQATGWGSQTFGTAQIRNRSADIRPASIQSGAAFGQPVASLWVRTLQARGWQADQHGLARIYNLKQQVGQAGAIGSRLTFGQHQIYNRNRFVRPSGVLGMAFGTAAVTYKERLIEPPSILIPGFGTAWISFAVRSIAPAGIYGTQTGLTKVGGSRFLQPEGFDASRFGTRIIPEVQSIYPQGWREVWGMADVRNARLVVKPQGFIPNGSEQDRFGTGTVFNLRQYMGQFHSEASQAIGEVFGQWTAIANRNRNVGALGFNASVVPRQYVENKARAVLPMAWRSDVFGTGFVAPAVRRIFPEAIEAPYISRWTAIANAARVLSPRGFGGTGWGAARLANTRRYYERVGNWSSQAFGTPFVDFARRTIKQDARYAIQPPQIPLPVVDTLTKYIEAAGAGDQARFGLAYLEIHWSKLYPRTGDVSRYGMPTLRKLTPELLAWGRNHEEHGTPTIMLFKQIVAPGGIAEGIPGRPLIRDRRSWVYPGTRDMSVVSTQTAIQNLKPDPPMTRWLFQGGGSENNQLRMGMPNLNQQVIQHYSSVPFTVFGEIAVRQNVVQPIGIYDFFATGNPFVSLRKRTVEPVGIESTLGYGRPRLNPHTIWATRDVTSQAIENHGRITFYPVDYPVGVPPLQGVGVPTIGLKYHRISNAGCGVLSQLGLPALNLKRRYIRPAGWKLSKVGWHEIPEFNRTVRQYGSPRFDVFGVAKISPAPYTGPQTIRPEGMAGAFGQTRIELFNRELRLAGWSSMAMGISGGGPRYMRQSLWVGEPDWPQMQGFDAAVFGKQWISLRVREVKPEPWDSFICDYDMQHFDLRMRVRRPYESGPVSNSINPLGWASERLGLPDLQHLQHFIRPDGNSAHFRNGGPTWIS